MLVDDVDPVAIEIRLRAHPLAGAVGERAGQRHARHVTVDGLGGSKQRRHDDVEVRSYPRHVDDT